LKNKICELGKYGCQQHSMLGAILILLQMFACKPPPRIVQPVKPYQHKEKLSLLKQQTDILLLVKWYKAIYPQQQVLLISPEYGSMEHPLQSKQYTAEATEKHTRQIQNYQKMHKRVLQQKKQQSRVRFSFWLLVFSFLSLISMYLLIAQRALYRHWRQQLLGEIDRLKSFLPAKKP